MTSSGLLIAILFAAAKPMPLLLLAERLELSKEDLQTLIGELTSSLTELGLQLVEHGGEVELVTHPETAEMVRDVLGQEVTSELSKSALETLAILAYRGPLTRPEIEQIRGVQSSQMLRHLLLRGLVEETGGVRVGQPLFDITNDLLKHFGLTNRSQFPEIPELARALSEKGVE